MIVLLLKGKVSAGYGIWQDDDLNQEIILPEEEVPAKTDEVAQVVGDSMLPKYKDGDLLFIQYDQDIHFGQVGVFKVNGENYVKKLMRLPNGIRLASINPQYEDIILDGDDELYTIGKVIGVYRE
jgi:phage repressor protein C with HTH and peptisase S24 domain